MNRQTHGQDKPAARPVLTQPASKNPETLMQPAHPAAVLERALLDPRTLARGEALLLQRTIGNQAVGRLLAGRSLNARQPRQPLLARRQGLQVQTKLMVGKSDSRHEAEADRVAVQVMTLVGAANGPKVRPKEKAAPSALKKPDISPLASEEGAAVDERLETDVRGARSAGRPLDEQIRRPLELAFGADFSRVRVHTDQEADRLTRSLQARAFTTGQDIFFRRGAYDPTGRAGQELIAHELTHVLQQQSGGGVQRMLQRAVGFEFETPWMIEHAPWTKQIGSTILRGLGLLGGFALGLLTGGVALPVFTAIGAGVGYGLSRGYEARVGLNFVNMSKYQVAHQGNGWKMTADIVPGGSVIEFVVDAVQETAGPAGRNRLQAVMLNLRAYAHALNAFNAQPQFTLDQVTHRDSDRRYRISISNFDLNAPLAANPQTTAGIRLERIGEMAQAVSAPGAAFGTARHDLMGMDGGVWGGAVGRYYQHAHNQVTASMPANLRTPQLKGLVALLISYIIEGTPPNGLSSDQAFVEYGKHITIMMARTDFVAMYNAPNLAQARHHFNVNPGSWATLVMNAAMRENIRDWNANGRVGANGYLLERSLYRGGPFIQPNQIGGNFTRQQWLDGIEAGQDLSKQFDPSSMGRLGARTDPVGPGQAHQGMILEFRKMGTRVPYTQWTTLALRVFDYIVALNNYTPGVGAPPVY